MASGMRNARLGLGERCVLAVLTPVLFLVASFLASGAL